MVAVTVPAAVISREKVLMFWTGAVPDPELEIRGGEGVSVSKNFLNTSVWSKNKGGGAPPRPLP